MPDDAVAPPPLMLLVALIVHPVDPQAHPSYPPGCWRWAVQLGGTPPVLVEFCATAGIGMSQSEAAAIGAFHAAGVAKALRLYGVPVEYREVTLGTDPIPAGSERVEVLA